VNGDGVPDHLVGLPFLNSGGLWDSGEVRVLSGADGTVLRTHAGTAILARYGMSVASIADIDGDGVTEYAIGSATSGTITTPLSAPVEVRSGASGLVLVTLVDPVPGGAFGWSVADAGDVDGDGTTDIAVGAPYSSPGGATTAGQAHLFSGATGALIRTLSGIAGDFFGDELVNAGDADGDGTPDLAVAASYASIAGPQSGSVRVYSGTNGNLLWSANGAAPYASMGSALANVGDIDGNGRDDLAVGSSGGGGGLTIGGTVEVFSNSGVQLLSFPGTETNDLFGAALARVGDLDGDLISELAIGRPGPHGGFGTPGRVRVVSLGSGATLFERTSPLPQYTSSAYGANLASAGDVTGDGLDDLLVADTVVGAIPILAIGQVDVLTWAGVPTGSNLFGSGCIGSSGLQPAIRTIGGPATTAGNQHLAIHLSNAQPASQAVLAIGGSNTAWAGGSLPFDLTAAGLPGCTLLVSLDLVFYSPVTTLAGTALVPTPIPPAPGLAGTTVHAQWLVIEPTTAAMTSGLTIVLQ